jgi:hypothetical protein
MKPATLDDVRLEDYSSHPLGGVIDPKIVRLAKAINYFGIRTLASCQGHLDEDHCSYPWISLGIYSADINNYQQLLEGLLNRNPENARPRRIEEMIEWLKRSMNFAQTVREYNSSNAIKWEFEHLFLRTESHAENEQQLTSLQEDADRLAEYIFKKSNPEEKARKI